MRWLCLIPFVLALSGCSGDDSGSLVATPSVIPVAITPPNLSFTHPLTMPGADNQTLRLGVTRPEAIKVFPKPDMASEVSDLPRALQGQTLFTSEAWKYGNFGFGVVMSNEQIALAQYVQEKLTEEQLKAVVQTARNENGNEDDQTPPFQGRFVRFYFWNRDEQPDKNERLMICAFQMPDSSWSVTTVLGASKLMDALGMTVQMAREDQDSAERTLLDMFSKQNKPIPSSTPQTSEPAATDSAPPVGRALRGVGN